MQMLPNNLIVFAFAHLPAIKDTSMQQRGWTYNKQGHQHWSCLKLEVDPSINALHVQLGRIESKAKTALMYLGCNLSF